MQLETKRVLIASVIMLLLQLIVSPNIAIFNAQPQFVVVFCLIISMLLHSNGALIAIFVLGLMNDFCSIGPVGATPLVLIIMALILSRLFAAFSNGTLFIPLILLFIASFLFELVYALIVVTSGEGVTFASAMIYRVLPTTLYDCALGLVMYPIFARLLVKDQATMGSATPMPRLR